MPHKYYDTFQKAIQKWGKESQMMIAVEEMSELTKEISKHFRGEDNYHAICEEMADVYIMLKQMEIMFGNENHVRGWIDTKAKRLRGMVEDED